MAETCGIRVRERREGRFEGSEIPAALERQWIQGPGPATKPRATTESGLRNVAHALLSGADGWMFDGEDALGQALEKDLGFVIDLVQFELAR